MFFIPIGSICLCVTCWTGSTIKHLNQEKFYKFSFEAPDADTEKIVECWSLLMLL